MAEILVTKTQDDIFDDYIALVQSKNPNINPSIEGSDFWLKGKVLSGILSGAYQDVTLNALNVFIQTSSSNFVDRNLSTWGLTARKGAAFATATVGLANAPTQSFTLPSGTLLSTDSFSIQFIVSVDTFVTPSSYSSIPIYASQIGIGYQLPIGSTVSLVVPLTSPVVTDFIVISSNDGSSIESDASCIQRNLEAVQIPRLGGTLEDYKTWIIDTNTLLSAPLITDAVVIPNIISSAGLVGCFGFGGSAATDVLLNQGLLTATTFVPYNRTLDEPSIVAFNNNVFSNKPFNDNILSRTNDTFTLPNYISIGGYIKVVVALISGVNIDTILTVSSIDSLGDTININITVGDLIKREIRRAITTFQLGAISQKINGIESRYIPISTIEQFIDNGLSGISGQEGLYASVIVSRKVSIYDGSQYVYSNITGLPIDLNTSTNIQYTYDITYDNITIEED